MMAASFLALKNSEPSWKARPFAPGRTPSAGVQTEDTARLYQYSPSTLC